MRVEINDRKKTGKLTNTWKLNNTLLNNQWIKEEITGKIKMYLKTNEHGNNIKFTGYSKSHSNREVYRNIYIKKQK